MQDQSHAANTMPQSQTPDNPIESDEPTGGQESELAGAYAGPEVAFTWQASEYVHHHKSMLWYAGLAVIVVILIALAVVLKLWLEIGVFLAMAAAVVVYANKPPRTMTYELSSEGIHIDAVMRPFSEFRSFGVIADEAWHSIDLEPAQRLRPRVVLLFNSQDYDEIVNHLELHLPREDRQQDIIDKLSRYLRF